MCTQALLYSTSGVCARGYTHRSSHTHTAIEFFLRQRSVIPTHLTAADDPRSAASAARDACLLCDWVRPGSPAPPNDSRRAAPVASPLERRTSRPMKDEPAAQWPPAGPWLWSEPQPSRRTQQREHRRVRVIVCCCRDALPRCLPANPLLALRGSRRKSLA